MCWDLRALWSAELLTHTPEPDLGPAWLGGQAWLLTCLTKGDQADFTCSELAGPGQSNTVTTKVKQSLVHLARMGDTAMAPCHEGFPGRAFPSARIPRHLWFVLSHFYFCFKALWFLRKYGPTLQDGTGSPPWCLSVYLPRVSQDSTKASCQHRT